MSEHTVWRLLRDRSGRIIRALGGGRTFLVTRHRSSIGVLGRQRGRRLVDARTAVAAVRGGAGVDGATLRHDLDRVIDQEPTDRV